MTERTKFAVIDCEDAPKWAGHESIWVAAYGRPGEHWCASPSSRKSCFASERADLCALARREHFRAFAGELPDESELDTYRGFCITGRRVRFGVLQRGARSAPQLTRSRTQPPRRVRRDAALDQGAVRLPAGAHSRQLRRLCQRTSDAQRADCRAPRRRQNPGRLLRLSGPPACAAARRPRKLTALSRAAPGAGAGRKCGAQPLWPLLHRAGAAGAHPCAGAAPRLRSCAGAQSCRFDTLVALRTASTVLTPGRSRLFAPWSSPSPRRDTVGRGCMSCLRTATACCVCRRVPTCLRSRPRLLWSSGPWDETCLRSSATLSAQQLRWSSSSFLRWSRRRSCRLLTLQAQVRP